jgi:Rps23 Pro-64 3,4-dihydroxylase Tpa1-like proline 4-hydroxylase
MVQEEEIQQLSMILDRAGHAEGLGALADRYKKASPFPHLVIDNIFDPKLLEQVYSEMVRSEARTDIWIRHNTPELDKLGQRSALSLEEGGFRLVSLLHSAQFLYLLSEATGIWNLLPDPYLHGSGYSIIPGGGKFNVHVDTTFDNTIKLTRRLVVIIYLNKDWKMQYGGQLELWDQEATKTVTSIEPLFNRTLIMEIGNRNFHGVRPVTTSAGRGRYSFMLYYSTAGEVLGRGFGVDSSFYAPARYHRRLSVRVLARRCLPPVLFDALRKWIRSGKVRI